MTLLSTRNSSGFDTVARLTTYFLVTSQSFFLKLPPIAHWRPKFVSIERKLSGGGYRNGLKALNYAAHATREQTLADGQQYLPSRPSLESWNSKPQRSVFVCTPLETMPYFNIPRTSTVINVLLVRQEQRPLEFKVESGK